MGITRAATSDTIIPVGLGKGAFKSLDELALVLCAMTGKTIDIRNSSDPEYIRKTVEDCSKGLDPQTRKDIDDELNQLLLRK